MALNVLILGKEAMVDGVMHWLLALWVNPLVCGYDRGLSVHIGCLPLACDSYICILSLDVLPHWGSSIDEATHLYYVMLSH